MLKLSPLFTWDGKSTNSIFEFASTAWICRARVARSSTASFSYGRCPWRISAKCLFAESSFSARAPAPSSDSTFTDEWQAAQNGATSV